MQKKSSSKKKIKRKIPGTSHPVTQQATEEEVMVYRYTETEKDESPEAKDKHMQSAWPYHALMAPFMAFLTWSGEDFYMPTPTMAILALVLSSMKVPWLLQTFF